MKISKYQSWLLAFALLLVASATRAADTTLAITGEVKTPLKLSMADLKAMPSAKINATDHDGTVAEYEGISVHDLLARAGVPQGESLRGDALRLCLLVKAADGYEVTFSLAELDPLFTDRQTLLVYKRNGADLDEKTGPLRLIIPTEKRQARWVRQVKELEIVRLGGSK